MKKGNDMPKKLKPAVGYIRMSTDRQEDSPARQRRDISASEPESPRIGVKLQSM